LKGGDRFRYQSVVDHYRFRPAYAPAIYDKLFSLVSADSLVLDIGCGPGKLAYPVARKVARVDAVDLSASMIEAARADPRDDTNINWIVGDAHVVDLDIGYDLMMAGASIHWMNLDSLFPILAPLLSDAGHVAFAEGDGAVEQPWGSEELALMKAVQLEINDERPEWVDRARFPVPQKTSLVDHPMFRREDFIVARHEVSQSIEEYIGVFFSRQSFALDCMPVEVAERFERDMRELLAPYAVDDRIAYQVESILEVGKLVTRRL